MVRYIDIFIIQRDSVYSSSSSPPSRSGPSTFSEVGQEPSLHGIEAPSTHTSSVLFSSGQKPKAIPASACLRSFGSRFNIMVCGCSSFVIVIAPVTTLLAFVSAYFWNNDSHKLDRIGRNIHKFVFKILIALIPIYIKITFHQGKVTLNWLKITFMQTVQLLDSVKVVESSLIPNENQPEFLFPLQFSICWQWCNLLNNPMVMNPFVIIHNLSQTVFFSPNGYSSYFFMTVIVHL